MTTPMTSRKTVIGTEHVLYIHTPLDFEMPNGMN